MGWEDGAALFDWCEPNYVHSNNVAEFFNTTTNISYCVIGLVTAFAPALVIGGWTHLTPT